MIKPSAFERMLSNVWPSMAVRRYTNRLRFNALYKASRPSKKNKRSTDRGSADAVNIQAADWLRNKARELEQNYDLVSGALDILERNVIGLGIRPEFMTKATGGKEVHDHFCNRLEKLWDQHAKLPTVYGEDNIYKVQRLMGRSKVRDGEVFQQNLMGRVPGLEHSTVIPLSIEPLEADFIPLDFHDPSKNIRQGIRKNAWGRPIEYIVHKTHPGDPFQYTDTGSKRVIAERMMHLKFCNRFHQGRGISVFASTLTRFDDIAELEESERVAARIAAALTGYVIKGNPDAYEADKYNADGDREIRMSPGMIFDDLAPGEDVGTIASNRPNTQLNEYLNYQIKMAASGIKCSYSSLSKNYHSSYSAQRQELVEQFMQYGVLWHDFKEEYVRPYTELFIQMAVLSGAITLPADLDRTTLLDASYSRPAMPWIRPDQEVKAYKTLTEEGFDSHQNIIKSRGHKPNEIIEQQRDWKKRTSDLKEDENEGR